MIRFGGEGCERGGVSFECHPRGCVRRERHRPASGTTADPDLDAPALLQEGLLALVLADLDHALLALATGLIGVDGLFEALLASLGARRGSKHLGGRCLRRSKARRRHGSVVRFGCENEAGKTVAGVDVRRVLC